MKLFKDITIKQKLQNFKIPDFDKKIAIVKKWHDDYHHGTLKSDKETSRAPGYNQDFFFDILGYTRKPAERATFDAEYNLNGKRPDGVLGFFHSDENISDNVCAVVELKGAGIPVDQPQKREKNYTPVEQAFGYKRQLRHCPFVIVSNFYELRLYNDNELDYELWTLDDLVDENDDYYNFKKFYYLLCEQNLIAETGTSQTESLLSEIRLEEQEITKRFYKDYKERRLQLFRNLYSKNEILKNNPDLLIEKGQKLIDRIIFMCFAEDRGLLPADILQKIKKEFEKSQMTATMWDALKQAFHYVDKGNERWNLPDGYNGGLFERDDIFDDLKVDGHVLSKVIDFGMYDFADDLSVNILGHIFEQSISDLEEIKTKIQEKGLKQDEKNESVKKISKRKKDGIFYTPEYIVDYIVKNSLGAYLREHEMKYINEENLHDELSESVYKKREIIAYTKYQEFLKEVKVLDPACGSGAFLVRVFDYLLEEHRRVGKILGGMFNVDEIYKDILQNNIYGVDLNQESVEITKLSLWLKSAQPGKKLSNLDNNIKCGNSLIDDPEIAGDKAFNWQKEFSQIMQNGGFDVIVGNPPYVVLKSNNFALNFFKSKYHVSIGGKVNLYKLFFELGVLLLNKNGYLGFITPSNFLTSNDSFSLRKFLIENTSIISIIDYPEKDNVFQDVTQAVAISILSKNKSDSDFFYKKGKEYGFIDYKNLLKDKKNRIVLENEVIKKIKEIITTFKDLTESFQGEINVSTKKDFFTNTQENDFLMLFRGNQIGRYFIKRYPKEFAPINISPRNHFKKERIVFQEVSNAGLSRRVNGVILENILCGHTTNYIFPKNKNINIKFLLSILNSNLINYFFKFFNQTNHVPVGEIKNIPIPKISKENQIPFVEKADIMLELNKKFHEQKLKFLKRMMDNYELEKANKKLEKFYEMEFGDFVKEMRKKGAKVGLSTQDELEEYFDKNKSELLELEAQIKKTDAEIDQMVYKLYGLNEEEIKIIENS